jgi:hypothetical protein
MKIQYNLLRDDYIGYQVTLRNGKVFAKKVTETVYTNSTHLTVEEYDDMVVIRERYAAITLYRDLEAVASRYQGEIIEI